MGHTSNERCIPYLENQIFVQPLENNYSLIQKFTITFKAEQRQ